MRNEVAWLFLPLWAGLMLMWLHYYYFAVPAALDRWAAEAGLRIVRKERRTFFKGPFFWTSSKSQIVYRVLFEGAKGELRPAWVRIGGYWWMSTERIDVRWDPPPESPREQSTRGNPLMWDRELDA